jgi:threonine aldolase
MGMIDLRSDTVTRPTAEMREAMYRAEVGDDVYGEDPTVNRLEEMAADCVGKEAALFVASGTMGNLVALLTHCGRGDEVILGDQCHSFVYEQAGMAALGGISPRPIPNQADGTLRPEDIEGAVRTDNVHFPRTRLLCLENTHNLCNGTALTAEFTHSAARLVREHGLRVHLDGARVFNAATALGVDVRDLVAPADSVMLCLSKGLCAPVGSLLCGTKDFIEEARRARKMLGGGMRQAGVLAAAGIVALERMTDRLEEDHDKARRLQEGLSVLPGVEVSPVMTNILYFRVSDDRREAGRRLTAQLRKEGVLLLDLGSGRFRAVTHYWISEDDIDTALDAVATTLH